MPIIEGVHICTTNQKIPRAGVILAKMENLLDRRRTYQISRRGFLVAWGQLRMAMRLTKDYQDLIDRVRRRANDECEVCHKHRGVHVHHIEPVAFKPRFILLDINCLWVCKVCHPSEDVKSRKNALHRRDNPNFAGYSDRIGTKAQPVSR